MKQQETLLDQEGGADNIMQVFRMKQDILTRKEESFERIGHIEKEEAAKQYQSIILWLKTNELGPETDQPGIFESILAEAVNYPGTSQWILKNPKIRSWIQSKPDSAIVWLRGAPGTGKSVISASLSNFMKATKSFIIYHFCTSSYELSTKYEQIMRWLLLQLLRRNDDLTAHVFEQFVLKKKQPTVPTLQQLLLDVFRSMSATPRETKYIWLILDGLHECETQTQVSLVHLINQITSGGLPSGGTICKVLISSRVSSTISMRLHKSEIVSLSDERLHLEKAIRRYAAQRLATLHPKLNQLHVGPKEVEDIELAIAKKADGELVRSHFIAELTSCQKACSSMLDYFLTTFQPTYSSVAMKSRHLLISCPNH
jgi:hypothetical protein